jgi:hypothetical protein
MKAILGVLDLICIIPLIFNLGYIFPLICAAYLIVKGAIFAFGGDKVSFADIGVGIILIFAAFSLSYWLISAIAIIYLLQKGIYSFI